MFATFVRVAHRAFEMRQSLRRIDVLEGELSEHYRLNVRLVQALDLPLYESLDEICFLACSSSNLTYCIVWRGGEILASYGSDDGLPSVSTPIGDEIKVFSNGHLRPAVVAAFTRRLEVPHLQALTRLGELPSSSAALASSS